MKKFYLLFVFSTFLFLWITWATNYSMEERAAYDYAYKNDITTMTSIDKANMEWNLTRIAMAKMLSNYAINILWLTPDTTKNCYFSDVSSDLDKQYDNWVTKACQLWLMGVWIDKFYPNWIVTRAEFWTVLSRLLYWNTYEWWTPYYEKHLNALYKAWIIKNISNPSMQEIRGYVMIMMMRSVDDSPEVEENVNQNSSMNSSWALMYKNSDFIEKEQPELTNETKSLIAKYHNTPSLENYLALREEVIKNYEAVLTKKEEKLEELKKETAGKVWGEGLVEEMEEIVQEMFITYWNRINSSMLRFTDTRLLKWKISEAAKYDYIPIMWAGESLYIKRTPVTNREYLEFIKATNYHLPQNWTNWKYPQWEDDYPINYVSYEDAKAYTDRLTKKDWVNTYRLPSESEWELAAGHMPKDADFNNNIVDSRVSVNKYSELTRWAHWGVDFWWNVWEWTTTLRSNSIYWVKWGSRKSPRTNCRTEYRKEWRDWKTSYDDVGFRVIKVLNGKEPEQKVNLYTLQAPQVSAKTTWKNTVLLSWDNISWAVEYQIFGYDEASKLLTMLDRTALNTINITTNWDIDNSKYSYIVQALSYTWISDNVSASYWVRAE